MLNRECREKLLMAKLLRHVYGVVYKETSLFAVSEAGHKFGRRRVAKSIMFTGATRLTNNTAEMSTIL